MPRREQTISERFGEVLRIARKSKNTSQENLAEWAEIDRTYASMIERGKRNPTLEIANRHAEAIEIKLSELNQEGGELDSSSVRLHSSRRCAAKSFKRFLSASPHSL